MNAISRLVGMPVLFIRNCVPSIPRRSLEFVLVVFENVRSAAAGAVISAPSTIQEYALLITNLTLLPVSAMDLITSTETVVLPLSWIVASESLVSFARSAATSLQLLEEPPIEGLVVVGVVVLELPPPEELPEEPPDEPPAEPPEDLE